MLCDTSHTSSFSAAKTNASMGSNGLEARHLAKYAITLGRFWKVMNYTGFHHISLRGGSKRVISQASLDCSSTSTSSASVRPLLLSQGIHHPRGKTSADSSLTLEESFLIFSPALSGPMRRMVSLLSPRTLQLSTFFNLFSLHYRGNVMTLYTAARHFT